MILIYNILENLSHRTKNLRSRDFIYAILQELRNYFQFQPVGDYLIVYNSLITALPALT